MKFEACLPIIWDPDYSHSVCQPLTDELIEDAEKKFNVTLPEDYLTLMRIRNGGFLGREGLIVLDNNQYDDGFVQLYDYPDHPWVMRGHHNLVTQQVEEKFRQQGLDFKLVHTPTL